MLTPFFYVLCSMFFRIKNSIGSNSQIKRPYFCIDHVGKLNPAWYSLPNIKMWLADWKVPLPKYFPLPEERKYFLEKNWPHFRELGQPTNSKGRDHLAKRLPLQLDVHIFSISHTYFCLYLTYNWSVHEGSSRPLKALGGPWMLLKALESSGKAFERLSHGF